MRPLLAVAAIPGAPEHVDSVSEQLAQVRRILGDGAVVISSFPIVTLELQGCAKAIALVVEVLGATPTSCQYPQVHAGIVDASQPGGNDRLYALLRKAKPGEILVEKSLVLAEPLPLDLGCFQHPESPHGFGFSVFVVSTSI